MNLSSKITWKNEIIEALKDLGGEAHLNEICEQILFRGHKSNNTIKQTVSRTIQMYSSQSAGFNKKNDLFYSVQGIGKGIWGLNEFNPTKENIDLTEDDISFPEGKKKLRLHIYKERNSKIIRKAKENFKKNHNGKIFCEICTFDYSIKYGEIGEGYIEGHHVIPVSELNENSKTRVEDIVLVCANCHRMLHRKRPWLSKKDLEELISQTKYSKI